MSDTPTDYAEPGVGQVFEEIDALRTAVAALEARVARLEGRTVAAEATRLPGEGGPTES